MIRANRSMLISTHAPRAGSDSTVTRSTYTPCRFQPTLPVRGATKEWGYIASYNGISTHAPRAGSDNAEVVQTNFYGDFNPRSPCGERPFIFSRAA